MLPAEELSNLVKELVGSAHPTTNPIFCPLKFGRKINLGKTLNKMSAG